MNDLDIYDIRSQIVEEYRDIRKRLQRIERYETFLMLCIVYWALVGMLSARVENFSNYMIIVNGLGLFGLITWHIRSMAHLIWQMKLRIFRKGPLISSEDMKQI